MSKARSLADLGNVYDDGALSNRNLIINGAMQVAQRGTQTDQTSHYTACDRWQFAEGGSSSVTTTQDTDVPSGSGFGSSLKIDVAGADTSVAATDYAFLRTKLEGQDLQGLCYGTSDAKQITLSFWVKSPKTGTHVVELRHRDADGGTQYNCQSYSIATADTWQKVTMTFVGQTSDAFDNDNGNAFELVYWLMAGSNYSGGTLAPNSWDTTGGDRAAGQVNVMDSVSNNFYLTGVQLEVGDTATPFEHRSYGDELARCKRYYEILPQGSILNLAYYVSTNAYGGWSFKVEKRSTPSIAFSGTDACSVLSNGNAYTSTNMRVSDITSVGARINPTTEARTAGHAAWADFINGYITADAEL